MKCFWALVLALLHCSFAVAAVEQTSVVTPEKKSPCKTIEVFSQQWCPHCMQAYEYLETLQAEHPDVLVFSRDLQASPSNMSKFIELNKRFNVSKPGVPSFYACGEFIVGFDEGNTGRVLIDLIRETDDVRQQESTSKLNLPVIGDVSPEQYGLPLFTLVIGLVDGFNPCAMWVLLFLLSMLVNLRNRRQMLIIAGTFVFVSGAVYFAFMAAWLNMFLLIGWSRTMQYVVATTALIVGAIHIKDYFAFGHGVTLSLPEGAKQNFIAHIRDIVQSKSTLLAVMAVIPIAIMVNFLELLCTAGLPALYTQVLTMHQLSQTQNYLYLVLYNLAYIFDDAVMVGIVIFTLTKRKMSVTQGKWLKLLSGSFIFGLGILLLARPELLI